MKRRGDGSRFQNTFKETVKKGNKGRNESTKKCNNMAVKNNSKQDGHDEVNFKRNVESNKAKRKGERYFKKYL